MRHRQVRDFPRRDNESDERAAGGVRKAEKPTDLLEAILMAAAQVGFDGQGEGGLAGYLKRIAQYEPKIFLRLLLQILAHAPVEEAKEAPAETLTKSELEEELRKRGLPIPVWG